MTVTDRMRRSVLCGAVAGALAAGMSIGATIQAQAQDTLERLQEQGYARIAIANEPPWTQVNADGTVTGAAPEVAKAVLARLGIEEVVASISEYGAMIPGLQARRFDLVTAGLFIKPERCAAVIFSEPDLCDAEAFAVAAGNPLGITSYAELGAHEEVVVGAPGGGTEERLALEHGVPRDRVIVVPDAQSGVVMLQDGRIDVYALPLLSLIALLETADDPNLELVGPLADTPVYCAGAAFHPEDTAFRDAYDAELAAIKESGEFAELIEPFGFNAEAATLTSREEQCGEPN